MRANEHSQTIIDHSYVNKNHSIADKGGIPVHFSDHVPYIIYRVRIP